MLSWNDIGILSLIPLGYFFFTFNKKQSQKADLYFSGISETTELVISIFLKFIPTLLDHDIL